ncbi:MAG: hypothetical protein FWG35_03645, partial [Spirochaetaceae bacterium]|nr:hypothetical protein [Spirochaetaceae bacterium]
MGIFSFLRRFACAAAATAVILFFSSCPYNEAMKDEMRLAAKLVFAHSWEELCDLIDGTPSGGSAFISIEGTLTAGSGSPAAEIKNKKITVLSFSGTGTILYASSGSAFAVEEGGLLILGHEHSGGTLIMDGGASTSNSIIEVFGGACVMNKGVILQNNRDAAAVSISPPNNATAAFTMNG